MKLNLKRPLDLVNEEELLVIANYIKDGDVIFDVGAHKGEWSRIALDNYKNLKVYLFEAIPEIFDKLSIEIYNYKENNDIILENFAIGDKIEQRTFYYYEEIPGLSGYYRRSKATEDIINITPKEIINGKVFTLDNYCKALNINKINILKIDTEGADFDVMKGAKGLIEAGKIDAIEFEYGGCWQENGTKLEDAYYFLVDRGYEILKATKEGLVPFVFTALEENYNFAIFLARRIKWKK
jgi:FkbM family methyltransferase